MGKMDRSLFFIYLYSGLKQRKNKLIFYWMHPLIVYMQVLWKGIYSCNFFIFDLWKFSLIFNLDVIACEINFQDSLLLTILKILQFRSKMK